MIPLFRNIQQKELTYQQQKFSAQVNIATIINNPFLCQRVVKFSIVTTEITLKPD